MEVVAYLRHPFSDGGLGDGVGRTDVGHGHGLQVGVAEGEVEAIDGKTGAGLATDVAYYPADRFEGVRS